MQSTRDISIVISKNEENDEKKKKLAESRQYFYNLYNKLIESKNIYRQEIIEPDFSPDWNSIGIEREELYQNFMDSAQYQTRSAHITKLNTYFEMKAKHITTCVSPLAFINRQYQMQPTTMLMNNSYIAALKLVYALQSVVGQINTILNFYSDTILIDLNSLTGLGQAEKSVFEAYGLVRENRKLMLERKEQRLQHNVGVTMSTEPTELTRRQSLPQTLPSVATMQGNGFMSPRSAALKKQPQEKPPFTFGRIHV